MFTPKSPRWISTRFTFDMLTGEILVNEGYFYDGEVAWCGAPPVGDITPAAGGGGGDAPPPADPGPSDPGAAAGADQVFDAEAEPAAEPAEAEPTETPGETVEEQQAREAAEAEAAGTEETPEQLAARQAKEAADAAKPPSEMDKALNEAYRDHPELKEFLKAHPQLKPQWFFASQVQKEGFRSIEDVKQAKEAFNTLTNFDSLYYSDEEAAPAQFVDQLWKNSLKDPSQPFHPQSNPSTGNFERVAERIVTDTLGRLRDAVAQRAQLAGLTPDQAKLAVDFVARMLEAKLPGGAASTQGAPAAAGTPTADAPLTARERQLAEREARIAARERETRAEADSHFQNSIQNGFQNYLAREVDLAMKPVAALLSKQPKGVQTSVRERIVTQVAKAVEQDDIFRRNFEIEMRRGDRTPEHLDRLVKSLEQRGAEYFPSIAKRVFEEFGLSLIAAQQQKTARQQQAESRREPSTSGSPGRLSGGPTRAQVKPTGNYREDAAKLLFS